MLKDVRRHAGPRIAHHHSHVIDVAVFAVFAGIDEIRDGVARRVRNGEREHPAIGHRIAGVDRQVHQGVLHLPGIGVNMPHIRVPVGFDPDGFAECTAQHGRHPIHQTRDIDILGIQRLAPGKRQKPLRQFGAAARGALEGFDEMFDLGIATHLFAEQFDVAQDDREDIVEVVGDATRQLTHDLHLLRLTQLLLGLLAIRDVLGERDYFTDGAITTDQRRKPSSQRVPPAVQDRVELHVENRVSARAIHHFRDSVSIRRRDGVEKRPAEDGAFIARAVQLESRPIHGNQSPREIHALNADRARLDERAKPLLARRQAFQCRNGANCLIGEGNQDKTDIAVLRSERRVLLGMERENADAPTIVSNHRKSQYGTVAIAAPTTRREVRAVGDVRDHARSARRQGALEHRIRLQWKRDNGIRVPRVQRAV